MKTKKYFRLLGVTSACVRRAVEAAAKFVIGPAAASTVSDEEESLSSTDPPEVEEMDLASQNPSFLQYDDIDDAVAALRLMRAGAANETPTTTTTVSTKKYCNHVINFIMSLTYDSTVTATNNPTDRRTNGGQR